MIAEHRLTLVCLAAALALTPAAGATIGAQTPVRGVGLTSRAATVVGTVVNGDDKPVPAARLRLRVVTSGRIVMTTHGNQQGEFRFGGVPRGSYLVEFIDDAGNIAGVSQTFSVDAGETLSTIVRLTTRRPWYSGFFSNAAVAAVSSAAALGVTAVGKGTQPASGRF